jgi:hypothetical protein
MILLKSERNESRNERNSDLFVMWYLMESAVGIFKPGTNLVTFVSKDIEAESCIQHFCTTSA